MNKKCSICGIFQDKELSVENLADEPSTKDFPDVFYTLITYKVMNDGPFEGSYSNKILQCPKCGLLYAYACSLPGGSYDAMRTWVVEKITPLLENGKHVRKNPPPKPIVYEEIHEYKCPTCQSLDVDCLDTGNIGGELFIRLKCCQCGTEDLLDEYQILSWRNSTND